MSGIARRQSRKQGTAYLPPLEFPDMDRSSGGGRTSLIGQPSQWRDLTDRDRSDERWGKHTGRQRYDAVGMGSISLTSCLCKEF